MIARARLPASTYRLQLRGDVDLDRAASLVPMLRSLGIGALYLSPISVASPGSLHGYDVLDPNHVDPELGGRDAFERFSKAAHDAGMLVLLDIVPNHLRAHADNRWWRDVLEHGPASRFAGLFDLRWSTDPEQKIVLPVLGRHYGRVLAAGELKLDYDEQGFVVRYHDSVMPLDPHTWAPILERAAERGPLRADLLRIARACAQMPSRQRAPEIRAQRAVASDDIRGQLSPLLARAPIRAAVEQALASISAEREHRAALHALLDDQAWRIAFWRSGLSEINYRRFFDIPELVALRTEAVDVFERTHVMVADLVARGRIDGVRVDHVDGLADPREYLARLRALGTPWIVVEKILHGDERMRSDWDADGTTGYDMTNAIAGVFVKTGGWRRLRDAFVEHDETRDLRSATRSAKLRVLDDLFSSALHGLAHDLRVLAIHDRDARDVSQDELLRALRELTCAPEVYRTYLGPRGAAREDRRIVERARDEAMRQLRPEDGLALDFIVRLLLGDASWIADHATEVDAFVRRWQQLTGPVMAKGVEDTLSYRFTPLLAMAEVGSDMRVHPDPVADFHRRAIVHREDQPGGLTTTATHDTKRGQDVRARICVLSELVPHWLGIGADAYPALRRVGSEAPCDWAEVERLLQTLVGAWPVRARSLAGFRERVVAYAIKAAREAKQHTQWLRPDPIYEAALVERVRAVFRALEDTEWGRRLERLRDRVAFHGAINGLGQVVLELASPGVCDIYQGTEVWDLRLVDPDNRRPVNFALLERLGACVRRDFARDPSATIRTVRERWATGAIKLCVLERGLRARRSDAELWIHGEVIPAHGHGPRARHVCAVARAHEGRWGLGIVTRESVALTHPPHWPIGPATWAETCVRLPSGAPTRWRDVLTEQRLEAEGGVLRLDAAFASLPVALCVAA